MNKQFPFIAAYGELIGRNPVIVKRLIQEAIDENAPINVVTKLSNGDWITLHQYPESVRKQLIEIICVEDAS